MDNPRAIAELVAARADERQLHPRLLGVATAVWRTAETGPAYEAAERIVDASWADGLEPFAREQLDRLEAEAHAMLSALDEVRVMLEDPAEERCFAAEVVVGLARRILATAESFDGELAAIEHALRTAPRREHAELGLRAVGTIVGRGTAPAADVMIALPLGGPGSPELARALATPERRADVRRATEELRGPAAPYPLLAAALERILAAGPRDDPGEDRLWLAAVDGLLQHLDGDVAR